MVSNFVALPLHIGPTYHNVSDIDFAFVILFLQSVFDIPLMEQCKILSLVKVPHHFLAIRNQALLPLHDDRVLNEYLHKKLYYVLA